MMDIVGINLKTNQELHWFVPEGVYNNAVRARPNHLPNHIIHIDREFRESLETVGG